MHRQRYNTDDELHIVHIVNDNANNVNDTNFDFLYKAIYNKYYWNTIMGTIFLFQRLINTFINGHTIYLAEWYTDPLLFMLANNYLYKRIHWNNFNNSYFQTNQRNRAIFLFFISIPIYLVINDFIITSFHISKYSISSFNTHQILLFSGILIYTFGILASSIYCIIRRNRRLLYIHIAKIILLTLYINLYNLLEYFNITYTVGKIIHYDESFASQTSSFDVEYHIHHWFYALCLLILTELEEPYHTYIQYLHYLIYLHGVSYYGYDTLIS